MRNKNKADMIEDIILGLYLLAIISALLLFDIKLVVGSFNDCDNCAEVPGGYFSNGEYSITIQVKHSRSSGPDTYYFVVDDLKQAQSQVYFKVDLHDRVCDEFKVTWIDNGAIIAIIKDDGDIFQKRLIIWDNVFRNDD